MDSRVETYKHIGEVRKRLLHCAKQLMDPQYYEDGIRGMDLLDLIEMLCDWKAATLRHADGDINRSIKENKERFGYSDELKQIFINTLKRIEVQ